MKSATGMQRSGWRGWAAQLLLPALLLVGLLPRGFVPDLGALRQGELVLTICRVGEAPKVDGDKPTDQGSLPTCAFGLLPTLSAAVDPPALPLPVQWVVVVISLISGALLWHVSPWMGGLGARGPPMWTIPLPYSN